MSELQTELMVQSSWLSGRLTAIGFHDPKNFPASPDTLLNKQRTTKPMNKAQWAAALGYMLGEPSKA